MAVRPILTAPDPLLLRVSAPVPAITDEIKTLVADMFDTMYHADGVGLAAAQVGVALRIAVTDVREKDDKETPATPRVFINPVIVEQSADTVPFREGCLSVPKAYAQVVRPTQVRVQYLDLDGVTQTEDLSGLQGVCLQHEMDHMQGILFIDHLPKLQRSLFLEKCEKLKRKK